MSDQDRSEDDSKSNPESQVSSQESTRKRKAYTTDQKLGAVDYANKYSKISASKSSGCTKTVVARGGCTNHQRKGLIAIVPLHSEASLLLEALTDDHA
uniref:Uncharacterized protein n=1 Tax=Ditylenchus dipsaci TaxID=166011 RepID=A0A915CYZ1_9BILA